MSAEADFPVFFLLGRISMKAFLMLVAMILFLSPSVRAEEEGGERFETAKSKILAEIDERIAHGQKMRSCVAAATDRDGLKQCREDQREWRKGQKEERKERREKRGERKKN